MTWRAQADNTRTMCVKRWRQELVSWAVLEVSSQKRQQLIQNALILPLFDCCDFAWSNLQHQDIDRLQRLQNKSAGIITRCSRPSEASDQLLWLIQGRGQKSVVY